MKEAYVMKARIKFSKSDTMKFIGHLDIMRYFQKAFRRAGIDMAYSQGFSPHQLISVASPLGVGLTSDGEYMDIVLNQCDDEQTMLDKINAQMVDGIKVSKFLRLSDDSKNAMSIVAAADYRVSFREGMELTADVLDGMDGFYKQTRIEILKKTKKSEKIVDIKPMIYQFCVNNGHIFMQLASGSAVNLKPELVMEAFYKYAGLEFDPYALLIHRLELYGDADPREGFRHLVALDVYGTELR